MEPQSKSNNPVMTAKQLTDAVNNNTAELQRVNNRTRNIVAALLVVLMVFAYSVKAKHDGEVSNCRRGNELRAQIDEKFGSIAALIEATTPPSRVTDTTHDFLDLLNEDFTPRDCGDIGWL